MHFCCNKLVDVGIFSKAKVCGSKSQQKQYNSLDSCSLLNKKCCSNRALFIEGLNDLKKAKSDFESPTITLSWTLLYTYSNLFEEFDRNIIPFERYKPPLITQEIFLLHETFLI